MLVTDFIFTAIRGQKISHCFMVPGGLNDAFMQPMTETNDLRTIVAAFEGGAAYMADGYSRASGNLGVCFGIGGPGVFNMVTALAAAKTDASSVLVINGDVPRSWEGLGGFQDASAAALSDTTVLKSVTDFSLTVSSPNLIPHSLRAAMSHAFTHHAPVHLSIPVDVQKADIEAKWVPIPHELIDLNYIDEKAFHNLTTLLADKNAAKNIILLAGPGIIKEKAVAELKEFAERFNIPVATTLSGKGAISEEHPLALGVFGYGGSRWATDAILSDDVDMLIIVGSGLSQRDTLQWNPKMLPSKALIHIDSDPTLIGRTWACDVPLIANSKIVLQKLSTLNGDAAKNLTAGIESRQIFFKKITTTAPRLYSEQDTKSTVIPMHPARTVTELRKAFPDNTVLCVDSGAHRAWMAEYWDIKQPNTHFSLTNLGPMGGAIPLGIGVQLALPNQPVVIATGDGCMLMHGMEFHTAAREGIPIIVAVMNNHAYGNIWYRASKMGAGPESLTNIPDIDWVEYAKAMGGDGERIDEASQIHDAVQRALQSSKPYLLDLHIDKKYPTPIQPWNKSVQEWEDND